MEELSAVQHCREAFKQADQLLGDTEKPDVKREAALAKTALEDAEMRLNRAFAKQHNKFSPGDVQRQVN